jgi:hypothetical protein
MVTIFLSIIQSITTSLRRAEVTYSDIKTRKQRTNSSVTKNQLFRDLIDQAVKNLELLNTT